VSTPGIYLDETVMRMCYTHRQLMVVLASELAAEGDELQQQSEYLSGAFSADGAEAGSDMDKHYQEVADSLKQTAEMKYDKALKVLEKLDKELPAENVPYDISSLTEAQLYVQLGLPDKARPILDYLWKHATQYVTYFESFDDREMQQYNERCLRQFGIMRYVRSIYAFDESKKEELEQQQMKLLENFVAKGGKLE
jgi:hypothetical protein